ncbi:FecR family protein [Phytopseudomonas dryadis]|uniref:Iron dicitrate transport regulator FecR n=1 Tax=Phytopseudomonas dryadis TaxID=2487520 RepID=A0A4Q9QUN7_9GAMM|nr:FecR domain-containing protein [Pseudomonas dryadis]TBU86938.1 hypothetical protein DNK44_21725 [Pseudomonas dryadis]
MAAPHSAPAVPADDPIREAAARWHDRLRHERVSAEDRAAFERWCVSAPAHRRAYDAVERAWQRAQVHAEDPQILALRQEAALRLTRLTARRRFTLPRMLATAAAMTVVGLLGVAAWRFYDAEAPIQSLAAAPARLLQEIRGIEYYRTAVGERLNVALDDGSLVTLNTYSDMKVEFTAEERKIVLNRGQVLFEVAKDSARPFVVEAQDRRFIAVGTAFDVRVDNRRVQLTMLEGSVMVEPIAAPPASGAATAPQRKNSTPELVLTAGQQLVAMPTQAEDEVRPTNADRVSSWRNGQVIFEQTRLADAVAELNRYTRTPIEIADPGLSDLQISGAFRTGRNDTFVEAVTLYFPIDAQRNADAILLTRRQ